MVLSQLEKRCFYIGTRSLFTGVALSILMLVSLENGILETANTFMVVVINALLLLGMVCGVYLWVKGFPMLKISGKSRGFIFFYISFNVMAAFWFYKELLNESKGS
jgi:predicted tellurium resistance membrane protein TerC